MTARRMMLVLLAMVLTAAGLNILPSAPAVADPAAADSPLTKSGTGDFANLKVTVSQTKNLINQVVTVSWTGGAPTLPASGSFAQNYLQIMQCWGDDPAGPARTQCQYGGLISQTTPAAGNWVRSRQVSTTRVDPKEELKKPSAAQDAYVPFWAAAQAQPVGAATSNFNDFFDSQVTNEIPLARTHGDGTGTEFFEIETVRQAAGLGCGDPVTTGGVTKARSCWLVVVPRGNKEVDGAVLTQAFSDQLDSSPLSQTNWDSRIVFPLDFLPVVQACPLAGSQRRVIGHELAVDAISSWGSALCGGGGAQFSYTQLSDDVIRSQVLDGSSPGLALMTNPAPPDQVSPDHPLLYAPVGLSGLAIAFNIVHQPNPTASPDDLAQDGIRFPSMKLNARLVAKLLTQSYRNAVEGSPDYLSKNPAGLTVDPEFLALNPEYTGFSFFVQPPDALAQLGTSDLTSLLWTWIKDDPDANAFMSGTPDKWGMVVNPNNETSTLPISSYPRNDPSCVDVLIDAGTHLTAKKCALDTHPYTNDMHDSGRAASRGDTKGHIPAQGTTATSIVFPALPRQSPNQLSLLAVVDTATAARYNLPTASLLNTANKFVAPTTDSLLAGAAAMKPSTVAGVLQSDPHTPNPAAYPLTALSYAVTSPPALDPAAGKDYAALVRYAAGPGQQQGVEPGQLPQGMAPLPDALQAQATNVANAIEAQAGKPISGGPTTKSTASGTNSLAPPGSLSSTTDSGATNNVPPTGGAIAPSNSSIAPAAGVPTPSPAGLPQQIAGVLRRTPALPTPAWVGAALLTTLIGGALAATSSPVLRVPALHSLGAAIRRRLRREVTPPKQ